MRSYGNSADVHSTVLEHILQAENPHYDHAKYYNLFMNQLRPLPGMHLHCKSKMVVLIQFGYLSFLPLLYH